MSRASAHCRTRANQHNGAQPRPGKPALSASKSAKTPTNQPTLGHFGDLPSHRQSSPIRHKIKTEGTNPRTAFSLTPATHCTINNLRTHKGESKAKIPFEHWPKKARKITLILQN